METYKHPIYKAWREKLQALGIPQVGGKGPDGSDGAIISSTTPLFSSIPSANRNDALTFRGTSTAINTWGLIFSGTNFQVSAGSMGHQLGYEWSGSNTSRLETWQDTFVTALYGTTLGSMTLVQYASLLFYDQDGTDTISYSGNGNITSPDIIGFLNTYITSRREVFEAILKGTQVINKYIWNGVTYVRIPIIVTGNSVGGFTLASDGVWLWFGWYEGGMKWKQILTWGSTSLRKTNLSISLYHHGSGFVSSTTSLGNLKLSKIQDVVEFMAV